MSYIGNQPYQVAFLTDTFSGNGTTTAFTMQVAPATTTSVLVAITGVVQDPSTYSVNGTTLTFSAAPPTGTSNISVRYLGIPASGVTTTAYRTQTEFTATAGQTTFSVPSYTVGYIDVYRNGLLLGSSDFTATNGTTVVLANACTTGDFVEAVSFYVSSVLNAIPATAGSIGQTYLAGNVGATGPAFGVYLNGNQAIPNATYTKIQFNTKEFDTNSNYDATTNFRFQPTVAGYYQIDAAFFRTASVFTNSTETALLLYKNGSSFKVLQSVYSQVFALGGAALVYANGSTDYFEIYILQNTGGSINLSGAQGNTWFQGFLARAA